MTKMLNVSLSGKLFSIETGLLMVKSKLNTFNNSFWLELQAIFKIGHEWPCTSKLPADLEGLSN